MDSKIPKTTIFSDSFSAIKKTGQVHIIRAISMFKYKTYYSILKKMESIFEYAE